MKESTQTRLSRRTLVRAASAATAMLASPKLLRIAAAATPIKIGIPTVITGGYAVLGSHVMRTCKLVEKMMGAKGVLGRPIEFLYRDTQGNAADCVRKSQELVERDDCRLIAGVVVSSEARAIMPKLAEWKAFFISHGCGDGLLTTKEFLVPNFFRANTSAPMGARTLALYLKDAPEQNFIALGSDYAWGRSSVGAFEEQIKAVGKNLVDKVFTPVGNKDYSTYITKLIQSGAQGCYLALQGDEARSFFLQATQYELTKRLQLFTEIVAQADIRTFGKDAIGMLGSSRYAFTYDVPENKMFTQAFLAEYKEVPDWTDGEMYQALHILFAAIEKADSIEADKLVPAMENLEVSSVKGPILMRQCDHQGENQGFVVKVAASSKYPEPIPEIVKIYPREMITPDCLSTSYKTTG
ncbi:MAG TPA: ABC transporter substrate-binding protein [Xanthobacteraceae bacterium]